MSALRWVVGPICVLMLTASGYGLEIPFEADVNSGDQLPPGDATIARIGSDNMRVADMLEMIASVTGWKMVCTEAAGNIRFGIWAKDITASELLRGVFKTHGVTHAVDNGIIGIMTRSELLRSLTIDERVIKLDYASPDAVANSLRAFLSGPEAQAQAMPSTRAVVIYDIPDNVERLERIAKELDVPLQSEVIRLANVSASDVVKLLSSYKSAYGIVVADTVSNQVLITDIPGRVAQMSELCKKLDLNSKRVTKQLQLRFADCERVAESLQKIFGLASGTDVFNADNNGSYGGRGGEVEDAELSNVLPSTAPMSTKGIVVPDPQTNSIWVTDTPERMVCIEGAVRGIDQTLYCETYQCNYIDPGNSSIDAELTALLGGPYDRFHIEAKTRQIRITSTPEKVDEAVRFLQEVDSKPAQVFIAGKVLMVNVDKLAELGVKYDVRISELDEHIGTELRASGDFLPLLPWSPLGSLQVGDLTEDSFTVLVEALEADAETKLLSSPRVLVTDGDTAQFTMSTDEPYIEVVLNADTGSTIENVKFKEVGVFLSVSPRIADDGNIAITVSLEVSTTLGFRSGVPVVSKSKVTSNVIVGDGKPLIIGGLISDLVEKSVSKVPVLGDIPLLGALFRHTREHVSQKELVLIMVPSIVGNATEEKPTLGDLEERISRRGQTIDSPGVGIGEGAGVSDSEP